MIRIATFCLLAIVGVSAQGRPDLSGTWIEDRERTINLLTGKPVEVGGSGGAMPLPPGETVVTQTPETLTLERRVPQFNSSIRYVYKLDGSKSVNHNGAVTLTTTSRWDGATLVTEGAAFQVTNQGEDSWTQREVLYLERGELVHELTSMRGGKVATSSRRIYRRAAHALGGLLPNGSSAPARRAEDYRGR